MAEDSGSREHLSKQERQAARQQAAARRRRRKLLLRGLIVGVVLLPAALWLVDRAGSYTEVEGVVVRTRLWRHRPPDGKPHLHSDARLLIEGLNEVTLRRADTLEEGDRVRVLVRHGRLTGWPYFEELAQEIAPGPPAERPTVPGAEPEERPSAEPDEEPPDRMQGEGEEALEFEEESR
jgi:hypothetical protein